MNPTEICALVAASYCLIKSIFTLLYGSLLITSSADGDKTFIDVEMQTEVDSITLISGGIIIAWGLIFGVLSIYLILAIKKVLNKN